MTAFPRAAIAAVLALCVATTAGAQQAEQGMTIEEFLASLDFRSGEVELPGGIAVLDMPQGFAYLSPPDAERVLVDAWGNPPGSGDGTLGMLVPLDAGLFGEQSWAVVISYEEEGHVEDDDAGTIDYDALLASMRESTRAANEARRDAGYPTVELVGWAAPPRYDASTHKLYWAKALRFEGTDGETLNYDVRVLGRKGVLVLQVIADMPALPVVEGSIPEVLAMTEFAPGHRYSDFDPSIDEVAAYGIGALIAGKVATKAGLLAKLGVLFLALKKFWIVIAIGALAMLRGVFGRRKSTGTA